MAVAKMKAVFSADIEKVWDIVTSCEDYAWRSDLDRIEVIKEGREFAEYTKDGYQTRFRINVYEPFRRYEFDMDNDNMSGHWTGLFSTENGKTVIEFTEDVTAKKFFMKPMVGMYLKKQQETYLRDLKKALGE